MKAEIVIKHAERIEALADVYRQWHHAATILGSHEIKATVRGKMLTIHRDLEKLSVKMRDLKRMLDEPQVPTMGEIMKDKLGVLVPQPFINL